MIDFDVHVAGSFSPQALAREARLPEAQRALTKAVIKYMVPYWAYDTGRLANSAYSASNYDTGHIIYDTSYAYEMFYGVRDNGKPVNYHLDKNPQAGPFPFDRMLADHENDIIEEVKSIVRD